MKSPFPGMDPNLEWHWGDVHTRLTTYASNQLAAQLPSDLRFQRPYRVCTFRASRPDEAELTRVPLRQALPAIKGPPA